MTLDVAPGVPLRNRHTGEPATVKDVDRHESGTWVTLDRHQAPGPPRQVGWLLSALAKHWERADVSRDSDLTKETDR